MNPDFIKVRTFGNIIVSLSIVIAGALCLAFSGEESESLPLLGIMMIPTGLLLLLFLKSGYKDKQSGEAFKRNDWHFRPEAKGALLDALAHPKSIEKLLNDGGQTISLTVYYNNRVAYFYLQEYKGFSYEECCEPVCYERAEADKFSLRLK